ncbi:hypothetical protein VTP01DRAFT_7279 [Rhizomucor pusillus]|uniref:uncharacterized protein n=1 Tax=Rhizomucor pusillus TaxID=4840 RepID=UPI003742267B
MQAPNHQTVEIRAALLLVACDIPTARKVSGFTGIHSYFACYKRNMRFPAQDNAEAALRWKAATHPPTRRVVEHETGTRWIPSVYAQGRLSVRLHDLGRLKILDCRPIPDASEDSAHALLLKFCEALNFGLVYGYRLFGIEWNIGLLKNIQTNKKDRFESTFMRHFLREVHGLDILRSRVQELAGNNAAASAIADLIVPQPVAHSVPSSFDYATF